MSKRKSIALTCSIAVLVAAVSVSAYQYRRAAYYERLLTQSYTHAFTELTTAAGELDSALEKATFATAGPLQNSLYPQIYAKALAAQTALGQLPYGNVLLEQTASFFAKTGDYALALSRGTIEGSQETLAALSQASKALSATLAELQGQVEYGNGDFTTLESAMAALSAKTEEGQASLGASAFQTVEADFPELPTLVYDGPFSDHLSSRTPRRLEGMANVTAEEARRTAADLLHLPAQTLSDSGTSLGTLPTFSFTFPAQSGAASGYIEVTRQGGQVLRFFTDYTPKEAVLSEEEAIVYAENYLVNWGFPLMEHSYTLRRDNKLTIHFAPVVDGIYCYPDLVKLTISLETGEVLGYEAEGYLSNHGPRDLPAPAVTQTAAASALPEGLTVLSTRLALIPTGGGTDEVLTYEFKTLTADGRHVLFYINAETGLQQNILLLLEDESGTLAL